MQPEGDDSSSSSSSSSDNSFIPLPQAPEDSSDFFLKAKNELNDLSDAVQAGLETKKSPTSVLNWIKLSQTLDGRDKITKVLQYMSRIVGWYYESVLLNRGGGERFRALQIQFTHSRKAYKLFRWINEWFKLKDLLESGDELNVLGVAIFGKGGEKEKGGKKIDVYKTTKKLSQAGKIVGLMGYWFGDNVKYLTNAGFMARSEANAMRSKRVQLVAPKFYLFGAVCGLVNAVTEVKRGRIIVNRLKVERDGNGGVDLDCSYDDNYCERIKSANSKLFVHYVALMKAICDIVVFSNMEGVDMWLKWRGKKLSDLVMGLGGIGSASTVIWNNFPGVGIGPK